MKNDMNEKEEKNMKVVHERDLTSLLEKMGARSDFVAGNISCKFCGNTMTAKNLHSILPQSGAVNMICDKPQCITALTEYMDERKIRKDNND